MFFNKEKSRIKKEIALINACRKGDLVKVNRLLADGVDINSMHRVNGYLRTPLEAALAAHNENIVMILLSRPDIFLGSADLLTKSFTLSGTKVFDRLIELGVPHDVREGHTEEAPLSRAAYYGSVYHIERLLECGADINRRSGMYGRTPLHSAVYGAEKTCAKLLIAKGANLNLPDKDGRTAAYYVSSKELAAYGFAPKEVKKVQKSIIRMSRKMDDGGKVDDVYDFDECVRLRTVLNAKGTVISTTIVEPFQALAKTDGLKTAFNRYRDLGGKAEFDALTQAKGAQPVKLTPQKTVTTP